MYTVIVVKFIKKHATKKTGTNSTARGKGRERRERKGKEEEVNIETVDHKNRTPGSRWAEGGMHQLQYNLSNIQYIVMLMLKMNII